MDPPPYEPIAGSSSSTGQAPGYGPRSSSYASDKKGKQPELIDGEIRRWDSLSSSSLSLNHRLYHDFGKNLDPRKDSLRVGHVEEDIYVSPGQSTVGADGVRQAGLEGSGRLNGYIQVHLTSPRMIHAIRVRLIRRQSLKFSSGVEQDDINGEELIYESGPDGIELPKGVSIFEFRFIVLAHSTIPEYHANARVERFVVAEAVGSAVGWFGKDLRDEEQFWIVPSPPIGEVDTQRLDIHSHGMTDALGPFSYDLTSSAFITSCALNVQVTLLSPPTTLTVYGIKVYMIQEATLLSHRIPGKRETFKSPKLFIVNDGPSGPYDSTFVKWHKNEHLFRAKGSSDEGWKFEELSRLPTDRQMRHTTHAATDTDVRISARLVVDIVYTTSDLSNPDSAESCKIWVATIFNKPVFIGHCATFDGRLALPDYKVAGSTVAPGYAMADVCLCKIPWETVRANELRAIEQASQRVPSSHASGTATPVEDGKADGRKLAETFPGDLDIIEGVVWDQTNIVEDTPPQLR